MGLKFEDGTEIPKVDAVIFSTGYSFGFPYLEEGVIPVHENHVTLFKYMYPPDLPKPTLIVVGLIQPIGAIMPISELQCRVACDILEGRSKIPAETEMKADIFKKRDEMAQQYVESRRHTIQVDYIQDCIPTNNFFKIKQRFL